MTILAFCTWDPRAPIAGLHDSPRVHVWACGRCGDRGQKRHSRVRVDPCVAPWRFADDCRAEFAEGRRGSVFILKVLAAKTFCTRQRVTPAVPDAQLFLHTKMGSSACLGPGRAVHSGDHRPQFSHSPQQRPAERGTRIHTPSIGLVRTGSDLTRLCRRYSGTSQNGVAEESAPASRIRAESSSVTLEPQAALWICVCGRPEISEMEDCGWE